MRWSLPRGARRFMRVPGLAKFLLVHRQSSIASLQWAEAMLSVMHDAGYKAPQTLPVLMSMSFLINPITLIDARCCRTCRRAHTRCNSKPRWTV
jgi:hypothetical protein